MEKNGIASDCRVPPKLLEAAKEALVICELYCPRNWVTIKLRNAIAFEESKRKGT